MNYYRKFSGNYRSKTAHLNLAQHGAYNLLLDHYYSTEKPIPPDIEAAYRICGAQDAKERKSVYSILEEFFILQSDGYHNEFADGEIEQQRPRMEAARTNGRNGGRPTKNKENGETKKTPWGLSNKPETVTQEKPSGLANDNPDETQSESSLTLAITRSRSKASSKERAPASPARARKTTTIPDGFTISDKVRLWAEAKGYQGLEERFESFCCKCRAKGYTYVDWDQGFMNAIRDDWANLQPPENRNGKYNPTLAAIAEIRRDAGIVDKPAVREVCEPLRGEVYEHDKH